MIISFGDKATESLYHGKKSKDVRRYPNDIIDSAIRKLDMLNGSQDVKDLLSPPGNQLELLKGDLKDFFSIRVNNQWRIIFQWEAGHAKKVKLMVYH